MLPYITTQWRWGEPALNPSVALTWVNGINYTSAEVEEQAHFLSTLFGCRVRNTWRTNGPLLINGI